jgi:hypothetical protein
VVGGSLPRSLATRPITSKRGNAIVVLSMMIGALTLTRIVSDRVPLEETLARARDYLHRQLQPH